MTRAWALLSAGVVALAGCSEAQAPSSDAPRRETRELPRNGEIVFVREAGTRSRLLAIGPNGGRPRALTRRLFADGDLAISPDGRRIAFSVPQPESGAPRGLGPRDIFLVGLDGGSPKRIVRKQGDDRLPHWSPDGKWIAFGEYGLEDSQLYVAEVENTGEWQVMAQPGQEYGGSWSPDGRRILYAHGGLFDTTDLFVSNVETGETRRLTSDEGNEGGLWGPDGRIALVTTAVDSRRAEILVMTSDGGARRSLATTEGALGDLEWSPDGARIAVNVYFSAQKSNRVIILSAHRDAGDLTVRDGFSGGDPVWSPDASRIAFMRSGAVWSAKADGSGARQLMRGRAKLVRLIAWLPARAEP
jgi:Tol biopolymer transport system component